MLIANKFSSATSLFLLFAVLILAAGIAHAQQVWPYPQDAPIPEPLDIGTASDRPVDISRFLLARGANSAKLNSSGEYVAFTSNITGVNQLWIMPSGGGQSDQLTFGNGITFFSWHPDGEQLLYGADNNGDEREGYYLISKDGLQEQVILESSNAFRSFGEFDSTGNRFSFASTQRNGRDFDIYVHDLKSAKTNLVYQAEFGFFPRAWRPNSDSMLVSETRGEDGNNLYLLDIQSGKLTEIFKPQTSAAFKDFNWKANGEGFYFSANQHSEMLSLQYYDMLEGNVSTITTSEYDIEDVSLCAGQQKLLYTLNDNGFEKLISYDIKEQSQVPISLTQGTYSISCDQNQSAVVTVNGTATPGSIEKIDLGTNKLVSLYKPNLAGINSTQLVAPEVITFTARDGVQVQGLLYMPAQYTATKPPIVIDIHGGPTAQSKASWQPLAQYLVGKGIAVLDINVRGSTGFGKTYARLDNQEKRLDSVRDLVDALAWLKQDGRVNAARAAAIGGSYGGYMVNAVMGAYPDAFKAGASFVGVADWVRALQTASPALKASDRIEYGDITEPKWQTFYAQNSPINTVDKIVAPMFFQHGVNDPRDPVTESDTMVTALRKRNIPVTYLRLPDEGHSIRKLVNRVMFYRQLADFLETHLQQ